MLLDASNGGISTVLKGGFLLISAVGGAQTEQAGSAQPVEIEELELRFIIIHGDGLSALHSSCFHTSSWKVKVLEMIYNVLKLKALSFWFL